LHGFWDLLIKNGGLEDKIGKILCDVDPNELVLLLGVLTYVPILVKIDQCDRESARRRTDTQIHWQTDTLTDSNRFYHLLHAIAIRQTKTCCTVCIVLEH